METQVNVDLQKVLETTQARLTQIFHENILLGCVVESQQEEIANLKAALDLATENMRDQNTKDKEDINA